MGVYEHETTKYYVDVKYNEYNDIKNILNDVIHYVPDQDLEGDPWEIWDDWDPECNWKYVEDLKERDDYLVEEFNFCGYEREVYEENNFLYIVGDYDRESGEGIHNEINSDLLFDKLFKYDPKILIYCETTFETDADLDNNECIDKYIYSKDKGIRLDNKTKIEDFEFINANSRPELYDIIEQFGSKKLQEQIK